MKRDSYENCHHKGNTLGASVKATMFSSDLKRAVAFFLQFCELLPFQLTLQCSDQVS